MCKKCSSMRIRLDELETIRHLAYENAQHYLSEAKMIAKSSNLGHAYGLLTLFMEELAKSHICRVYMSWQTELQDAKLRGRQPSGIEILKERLNAVFVHHKAKRLTICTQYALLLTNTPDAKMRKEIINAIISGDPSISSKLSRELRILKGIDVKRDNALYVNWDCTGPSNITEKDYRELLGICEHANKYPILFSTIKPYGKIKTYADVENAVFQLMRVL